jgi:hypothetical protein
MDKTEAFALLTRLNAEYPSIGFYARETGRGWGVFDNNGDQW